MSIQAIQASSNSNLVIYILQIIFTLILKIKDQAIQASSNFEFSYLYSSYILQIIFTVILKIRDLV